MTLNKLLERYDCEGCKAHVQLLVEASENRDLILRGALGLPSPVDAHNAHGGEFDTYGIVPDKEQ